MFQMETALAASGDELGRPLNSMRLSKFALSPPLVRLEDPITKLRVDGFLKTYSLGWKMACLDGAWKT